MKAIAKRNRGRLANMAMMASVTFVTIVGMHSCAGCGNSYVRIDLERPSEHGQPCWVGVYYLAQESALDGIDTIQLTKPGGMTGVDGVVDKEVFALYPGTPKTIDRPKFNPLIRWVVIAAGFPQPEPCARQKVSVKEGAKLTITVNVDDRCVNIVTDD